MITISVLTLVTLEKDVNKAKTLLRMVCAKKNLNLNFDL